MEGLGRNPAASTPPSPERPTHGGAARAWLVGPILLAAVVAGALLVLRGLDRAFASALTSLFGLVVVWILVSVFWPGRPDRSCPKCAGSALRRIDPHSTRGVACDACGHLDPDASSFLLAEDEGVPIEPMRMRERARARGISR